MNSDGFLDHFLKEKLHHILANRVVIFFFVLCLLTLFLYMAGTVQGFIDSTQLSLLSFYTILGIFLTITSLYAMVLNIRRLLKTKKTRYLIRALGYVFLVLFGIISELVIMFIITLVKGNA